MRISLWTRPTTADISIIAVNTYSVVLKPEYREKQEAIMGIGANTAQAAMKTKVVKKLKSKSAGGGAGWFLFILKVNLKLIIV